MITITSDAQLTVETFFIFLVKACTLSVYLRIQFMLMYANWMQKVVLFFWGRKVNLSLASLAKKTVL